jgi:hypothetical protein
MSEKKPLFGRGGFNVNEKGDQGVLGWWPEALQSGPNAGAYCNALFGQFSNTLKLAQRYHTQNQSVIEARAANRLAELPDPLVRQRLAREDQKRIAAMKAKVDMIDGEIYGQRLKLRPYEYDHSDLRCCTIR